MKWIHRERATREHRPLMRVRPIDGIRHGQEQVFDDDEIERARLWAARRLRKLRTEDDYERGDDA